MKKLLPLIFLLPITAAYFFTAGVGSLSAFGRVGEAAGNRILCGKPER